MCGVSILLQNHRQRNMKRTFLTWFSYTVQVKCKSWLEWDLNAIQVEMCGVSILLQNHRQRNMKRKFLTWFLTLPKQVNCKSWLEWDLNAIQKRIYSVLILLQNLPQKNIKRRSRVSIGFSDCVSKVADSCPADVKVSYKESHMD